MLRDKSNENWRVASDCKAKGNLNAAANRYYYAVFQAVISYATAKSGYARNDRSVHTDIEKLVGRTGKQAAYYLPTYQDLRSLREQADYDREPVTSPELDAVLADAEKIRDYYLKETAKCRQAKQT